MPNEPTSHILLLDMIGWATSLDASGFCDRVGKWALVGPPVQLDADDWSYRTLSARSVREELQSGDILVLRDSYAAYPLKKSRPGPFADTILIGRASSNDVRIPHTSISKLHARVRFDAAGVPSISDAGSSNGTMVRERALFEGEWATLDSGDVVTLGSCTFRVLDGERLYHMVRKFGR